MLITRVELENFKSYAREAITFEQGTNAIIGANGAGKSSLLEAIGFALFDYRPEGFKTENLLREGASSARVVVQFVSSDERLYEVERVFNARTTSRYRIYDPETGQYLAEGNEGVSTWLHDQLCPHTFSRLRDIFENTVGVPQGTLTGPFLQPPSARKAIFDPLLQVDDYRKASDNLREAQRHLEEQANAAERDISRLEGQLERMTGLEEEQERRQAALAEIEAHLRETQAAFDAATAELQTLDEAERRARETQQALERAQQQVELQRQRLADARRALDEAEEAHRRVEGARPGHEAYLQADEHLRELEQRRSEYVRLEAQANRLRQQMAGLSERLRNLEAELARMDEEQARLEALRPQVQRQEEIEAALDKARREQLSLENARRRLEEIEGQLWEARQERERIASELSRAQDLEGRAQEAQEAIEELERRSRQGREEIARVCAEQQRLERQSEALRSAATTRCPTCEAELTPQHRDELLARNTRQMAALQQRIVELEAEVKDVERERRERQTTLERLQRELRGLASPSDLQRAEERFAERAAAHERAATDVDALADAPRRAEALEEELRELGDPRREAQRIEGVIVQREAHLRRREETQAEQRTLQKQLAQITQDLDAFGDLDGAIQEARATRDRYAQAHEVYMANVQTADQFEARAMAVRALTADLEAAQSALQEAERQHHSAAAAYDAEGHQRARQREAELREALAADRTQLKGHRERLDEIAQEIARLRGVEETLHRQRAALQETEELIALVRTVREILRQAGPYVTQQLVYQISCEASAIYADLMGDHTVRLDWSEDYELALEVRGHRRAFPQFSGGEQMCAALALRLALLREMSAFDIAFFDEPTAHLDPERREGLAERIMQVRGFSQMFVISHDDSFERVAQNYLRIVKDENGSHLEEA